VFAEEESADATDAMDCRPGRNLDPGRPDHRDGARRDCDRGISPGHRVCLVRAGLISAADLGSADLGSAGIVSVRLAPAGAGAVRAGVFRRARICRPGVLRPSHLLLRPRVGRLLPGKGAATCALALLSG
jgi:hypothetical protein